MAYTYRLYFMDTAPGITHTATVYGDDGIALVTQPASNIRDLGGGAYLFITAAMPEGQGGAVTIKTGGNPVAGGVISPPETESATAASVGWIYNKWTYDVVTRRLRIYARDGVTGLTSAIITKDALTNEPISFTPDPVFVP